MDQPLTEKLQGKSPPTARQARILVASLDWGLGHATRCIPIIRELLAQGSEVWLAGEGAQKKLLETEFPELPMLDLPGYRIHYAKTARGLIWKMIQQGPKLRRAIQYENRWLKKVVTEHGFNAVISDNRYGLYHPTIPCIFITHQLTIKSSAGKWTERILQKRNYRFINRFTACWVPDLEGEENLAGELSHPLNKPSVPVHYIGLLSRFTKNETVDSSAKEKKDHLLIILSGPEPQRTILEEKIINEVSHYHGTATIVRGLPGSASLIPSTNMLHFYNHLPAAALNDAMLEAAFVISRSGYSTVMDIMALQKKTMLIPTPGQTEQEYLGQYLMGKGMAVCVTQNSFSLTNALATAAGYTYKIPLLSTGDKLAIAIKDLLTSIR